MPEAPLVMLLSVGSTPPGQAGEVASARTVAEVPGILGMIMKWFLGRSPIVNILGTDPGALRSIGAIDMPDEAMA
jgi:hypothetical protein